MTQEAMKLALEALEGFYEYGYDRQECFEHITAIKEALAEHAMREVQRLGQEIEEIEYCTVYHCAGDCGQPHNQEEMSEFFAVQPEQEPVAWGVFEGNLHDMFFTEAEAVQMADLKGTHAEVKPLYTTPPQRTQPNDIDLFWRAATTPEKWVGLTDEDKAGFWTADQMTQKEWGELFAAIEAKLKEKNT
jgi:hypothetical protein